MIKALEFNNSTLTLFEEIGAIVVTL